MNRREALVAMGGIAGTLALGNLPSFAAKEEEFINLPLGLKAKKGDLIAVCVDIRSFGNNDTRVASKRFFINAQKLIQSPKTRSYFIPPKNLHGIPSEIYGAQPDEHEASLPVGVNSWAEFDLLACCDLNSVTYHPDGVDYLRKWSKENSTLLLFNHHVWQEEYEQGREKCTDYLIAECDAYYFITKHSIICKEKSSDLFVIGRERLTAKEIRCGV